MASKAGRKFGRKKKNAANTKAGSQATSSLHDQTNAIDDAPGMTLIEFMQTAPTFPTRVRVTKGYLGVNSDDSVATGQILTVLFPREENFCLARDIQKRRVAIPMESQVQLVQLGLAPDADEGTWNVMLHSDNPHRRTPQTIAYYALFPLPLVVAFFQDARRGLRAGDCLVLEETKRQNVLICSAADSMDKINEDQDLVSLPMDVGIKIMPLDKNELDHTYECLWPSVDVMRRTLSVTRKVGHRVNSSSQRRLEEKIKAYNKHRREHPEHFKRHYSASEMDQRGRAMSMGGMQRPKRNGPPPSSSSGQGRRRNSSAAAFVAQNHSRRMPGRSMSASTPMNVPAASSRSSSMGRMAALGSPNAMVLSGSPSSPSQLKWSSMPRGMAASLSQSPAMSHHAAQMAASHKPKGQSSSRSPSAGARGSASGTVSAQSSSRASVASDHTYGVMNAIGDIGGVDVFDGTPTPPDRPSLQDYGQSSNLGSRGTGSKPERSDGYERIAHDDEVDYDAAIFGGPDGGDEDDVYTDAGALRALHAESKKGGTDDNESDEDDYLMPVPEFEKTELAAITVEDVSNALSLMGLAKHSPAFEKEQIDGFLLQSIDEAMLETDLGVTDPRDRDMIVMLKEKLP